MELHKLYRNILASMNVVADSAGLLSLQFDEISHPITVESKRLVLPTPEVLRNGLGDSLVAFHPLSENILRGESPVLRKMKIFVTEKLTQVLSTLMERFVSIASDHKGHIKLSPDQKELLMVMPDADEKSYQTLEKIFAAMRDDARHKLISVYLKRGGNLRKEKYSRTAIVSFPILREFENEEYTIYGVKCRKKDFVGLQKLIDYILPSADTGGYSYGSNDPDVPYFDALVHAFTNVATQLNSRVSMFAKHLPMANELLIDLSWNTVDNTSWGKYRDLIPVLNGNDGVAAVEEVEAPAAPVPQRTALPFDPARSAASGSAPTVIAGPPAQTHAHKTEEVQRTGNGLNWQSVMESQQRRSLPPGPVYPTLPAGYQVGNGYSYAPTVMPAQAQHAMAPNPGYPQHMTYMDPSAYVLPPGFVPAGPPQPTHDAWGRVMGPPMMQPPQPQYYNMAPGYPPGYGPPPPGYGAMPGYPPQPYYPQGIPPGNPGRVPSFGPAATAYAPHGAPPGGGGMFQYATGAAGVPVYGTHAMR